MTDPLADLTGRLLDAAVDVLTGAGRAPCRAVRHPGPRPPADVCEHTSAGDGQAWVGLVSIYPTSGYDRAPWPAQTSTAVQQCSADLAVTLSIGTLRCAATIDNANRPPTPARVRADADGQTADAALLYRAMCVTLSAADEIDLWLPGRWTPIGPQGGCVGGEWQVTIPYPTAT